IEREELEQVFRNAAGDSELHLSWFATSADEPGQSATREALAGGADVVVAAGGDGTVRAVAEGLADTNSTADLGILPLGTGNLFARNLGVAVNNLPAAVETIV